jgi:molecular chaperone DnaK
MVNEAESHAVEDKTQRDLVEKRNTLDNMIYQAEKTLRENAEKVPDAEAEAVRKALEAAKQDLESQEPDKLEAARHNLEQQLHRLAETLYKAQGGAGAAPGPEAAPPQPGGGDADVVDAEYTEEKGNG